MNRKLDTDNRFDRTYLEFSQESRGRVLDPFQSHRHKEDRFACLRGDYREPPKTDDRFACLRGDYREPPKTDDRFSCMREPQTEIKTPTRENTALTILPAPSRPPGLPLSLPALPHFPRKKAIVQTEEQFPSLPTSPSSLKTPKTPKWVAEPLREEIEFIPLPKPEPKCVSVSVQDGYSVNLKHSLDDREPEQMYKVIRKISGGSWSDRVKFCSPTETAKEAEPLNYDEDGFPMIHGIEDMVNSFS